MKDILTEQQVLLLCYECYSFFFRKLKSSGMKENVHLCLCMCMYFVCVCVCVFFLNAYSGHSTSIKMFPAGIESMSLIWSNLAKFLKRV